MNYKKLLKKYEKNNHDIYVNGEKRSPKYEREYKQKQTIRKRYMIADILFNEVPFHLNDSEKDHVRYLIDHNKNFKKLHGKASNETIILAFIFYTKLAYNHRIKIDEYKISRKYNLTHYVFERIICRITLFELKETVIEPRATIKKDHNLLYKGKISD